MNIQKIFFMSLSLAVVSCNVHLNATNGQEQSEQYAQQVQELGSLGNTIGRLIIKLAPLEAALRQKQMKTPDATLEDIHTADYKRVNQLALVGKINAFKEATDKDARAKVIEDLKLWAKRLEIRFKAIKPIKK